MHPQFAIRTVKTLEEMARELPRHRSSIAAAVLGLLDYVCDVPKRVQPLERKHGSILRLYQASTYGAEVRRLREELPDEEYARLESGLRDCVLYCQLIASSARYDEQRIRNSMEVSRENIAQRFGSRHEPR